MKKGILPALLIVFITFAVNDACAQQIAKKLNFPIDGYTTDNCLGWGEFGFNQYSGKKHIADDYCTSLGTDVKAIAPGKIKSKLYDAQGNNSASGWYGYITTEHQTPTGKKFCSIYGHTKTDLSENFEICQGGTSIGKVIEYPPSSNHIHYGIYIGECNSIVGYLSEANFPGNYVNPIEFTEMVGYTANLEFDKKFRDTYIKYGNKKTFGETWDHSYMGAWMHQWPDATCSVNYPNTCGSQNLWVQDFLKDNKKKLVLVLNQQKNIVYPVQGKILEYWFSHSGYSNYGPPMDAEWNARTKDASQRLLVMQHFQLNGVSHYIGYDTTDPLAPAKEYVFTGSYQEFYWLSPGFVPTAKDNKDYIIPTDDANRLNYVGAGGGGGTEPPPDSGPILINVGGAMIDISGLADVDLSAPGVSLQYDPLPRVYGPGFIYWAGEKGFSVSPHLYSSGGVDDWINWYYLNDAVNLYALEAVGFNGASSLEYKYEWYINERLVHTSILTVTTYSSDQARIGSMPVSKLNIPDDLGTLKVVFYVNGIRLARTTRTLKWYVAPPGRLFIDINRLNWVYLNWNPVYLADEYILYRQEAGKTEKMIRARTTDTEFVDSAVMEGKTYTYSVSSCLRGQCSSDETKETITVNANYAQIAPITCNYNQYIAQQYAYWGNKPVVKIGPRLSIGAVDDWKDSYNLNEFTSLYGVSSYDAFYPWNNNLLFYVWTNDKGEIIYKSEYLGDTNEHVKSTTMMPKNMLRIPEDMGVITLTLYIECTPVASVQKTITCVPSPISGLRITNLTYKEVKLAWQASPEASEYIIKRNGVQIGTTDKLYYSDTAVVPNTKYAYQIYASCKGTLSATAPSIEANVPNAEKDSDGDGVPDAYDQFPTDPNEWADFNNDGIGDNQSKIGLPLCRPRSVVKHDVYETKDGGVRATMLGLCHEDNTPFVEVFDMKTKEHLKNIYFFGPDHTPLSIDHMQDMNGNGSEEIIVLAFDEIKMKSEYEIRDSVTGEQITNAFTQKMNSGK